MLSLLAMKNKKSKKSVCKNKSAGFCARHCFVLSAIASLFLISLIVFWVIGVRSPMTQSESFEVSQGASVGSIAIQLKERGWIDSVNVYKIMIISFGSEVQTGVYDIPANTSVWRIAKMMAKGETASTTVIIPEGLTTKQIVAVVNADEFLTGPACVTACPSEGELFPDTYRVSKGTKREVVIEMMKTKMNEIQRGWEVSGRHAPRPLKSWNEVITLASIVQKETPKTDEMPIVASVYLNRLNKRMKLQADPTVVYAITKQLGDMKGAPLLSGHLQIKSPFNTYRNYGLPPSPIANPGREAITSVLNPADTNYLFFVADGQGGHNFSETYAGHKAYRELWREIKKAK